MYNIKPIPPALIKININLYKFTNEADKITAVVINSLIKLTEIPTVNIIVKAPKAIKNILKGTVGAQTRTRKTIIVKVDDPETGNDRIECFFNVVGVTDEGAAPSDGYWSETCSFECPPQDYCRLTRLVGQG